jgi:hypothetical protein
MEITLTHISNVINFLNIDFDTEKIDDNLVPVLQKELEESIDKSIDDWELEFLISYVQGDELRVFNKIPVDKEEKLKTIIIHIPIPLKKEVSWGVLPEQYISSSSNKVVKNIEKIEVNYNSYNFRKDYIFSSIVRGIKCSLSKGFKISGVKIKNDSVNLTNYDNDILNNIH